MSGKAARLNRVVIEDPSIVRKLTKSKVLASKQK